MLPSVSQRRFWVSALATLAIIYSLIMVGGIVRASGAGMGCPDWPTCFGQWIPPTHESQLPSDYQQIYADRGYANTVFNARKTWTEYLNRLLGVVTGLSILFTLVAAWPYRKTDPPVLGLALAGFVLVCVQGWLGARVVASNLMPGMITIHMLMAQLIVGVIIAALVRSGKSRYVDLNVEGMSRYVYPMIVLAMVAGLVQMVMGTQVREAVDHLARLHDRENRHLWVDNLPIIFAIHKYYAAPLIALNGWIILHVLTHSRSTLLKRLSVALGVCMLGTTVIGMSMDQLHLPMFAQPLHLWLASLIFGLQLAIMLILQYARESVSQPAVTLTAERLSE